MGFSKNQLRLPDCYRVDQNRQVGKANIVYEFLRQKSVEYARAERKMIQFGF